MASVETSKPAPSLRLVDKTLLATHRTMSTDESAAGPLIACGGLVEPYRVFRLVKNSSEPTEESRSPAIE